MDVVVLVGAGLDVHKKRIVACCVDGRSNPPTVKTRTFGTFLDELERMRSWLLERGCTHVAMESTGVYWMPVYRVLEGSLEIVLGNARHMANVPGRKTDMKDAEWIAQLLRHGLIRKNFVPPRAIRDLRQLTRYRRKLVQTRTSAQLRVEKLLQCTNIKLSSVASEVFGVSGRLMLSALACGITDREKLAELSRGKLRKKRAELARAFDSSFSADDARLLDIQLGVIESVEEQLGAVEAFLEERVADYNEILERLDTVPGINRTLAIDLLAEIGTDMSAWPSARHFAAWTGTAPGNRESAGVRRRARSREGDPYVKCVLVQAASSASRVVGSYLASRYHRLAARRGQRRALLAIAHELATAVYYMLARQESYKPPLSADPEVIREQRRKRLIREMTKLGYQVSCTPSIR